MLQPTLASKFDITGDNIRSNKADLKAEIHFIGQIVGGIDFETEDGLFCELAIDCGD